MHNAPTLPPKNSPKSSLTLATGHLSYAGLSLEVWLGLSPHSARHLTCYITTGSEAMEGVIKVARQYFYETKQPKRTNFIARKLSYHGNTVATLTLSYHQARRTPYEDILDHEHFHHVSPAYAKRYQKKDETEEEYVARLAQELEDKFQELGPDTVIACELSSADPETYGAHLCA